MIPWYLIGVACSWPVMAWPFARELKNKPFSVMDRVFLLFFALVAAVLWPLALPAVPAWFVIRWIEAKDGEQQ